MALHLPRRSREDAHKTFNGDAPDPYRIPDDQQLVSQLIFLGDSPAFDRFIDRGYTKSLMTFYLKDDDSARVGPPVRRAQAWGRRAPAADGMRVLIAGGAGPTALAVNEHTTQSKLLNILLVLVAIYLVSSPAAPIGSRRPLRHHAARRDRRPSLRNARLDGHPARHGFGDPDGDVDGIRADYAIYFLYRLREERAARRATRKRCTRPSQTSGRAVIFVAASIAAGFSVMGLFSDFYGLWLFGTIMPVAMVFSCVAALSLMPVLALRMRPAFLFGSSTDETDGLEPRPAVS